MSLANLHVRSSLTSETSPQQHLELLQLINDQPSFRKQLQSDPRAALAELGLTLDPADIPQQVTLPDTAELRAGQDDLADDSLNRILPWWPFLTDDAPAH